MKKFMQVTRITTTHQIILVTLLLLTIFLIPATATRADASNQLTLQPSLKDGIITLVFSSRERGKPVRYKIFTLDSPPRLVIDFPGSACEPQTDEVNRLLKQYSGYCRLRCRNTAKNCRVVLDTEYASLPPYIHKEKDNCLRITLQKAPPGTSKVVSDAKKAAPAPAIRKADPFKPDNNHPISVDFKGTDIQNVLRFLAEINHLNVVMGDDVSGTVTLKLKDVPWKQALDIVLRTHQLGMERTGNVIRIAPVEVFIREHQAREERAKREAESLKSQEELQPTILKILKVNFANIDEVAGKIENTILSDRGTIETDPRTNSLIINDIPDRIDQAKALLDELDAPVCQVMIEAKIVKIEKKSARELGVQWGGSYKNVSNDRYYGISGNNSMGDTGLPPVTDGSLPALASSYAVNLPATAVTSGIGLIFGKINKYNLSVKLSAMQGRGTAKILSSPKVLALNQHTARIGQGQEIPYQTTSQDGTTTEFKKAELSLEVTPTITNNGMVSMEVVVSKDSKGENTPDGPAINTQTITTSLLLKDGETAVVGGILESSSSKSTQDVPVVSKIPLLGWLFRHDYKDAEQTELMIFITPRLIK